MSQKITLCEQDITEEFAQEIAEILSLLGFEEGDYMVTDDSSLGDFYCRYPEHESACTSEKRLTVRSTSEADLRQRSGEAETSHYDETLDRRQNGEIWEAWIAGVWAGKFPGASSENLVDTPLVRLAQRIRESRMVH